MQFAPWLLSAALLCAVYSAAQDPKSPPPAESFDPQPEPQSPDIFYALKNGRLAPLERATGIHRYRINGFMVGMAKSTTEYAGTTSPVRFHSEERLEFVARSGVDPTKSDPNFAYCVRKLERKAKVREFVTGTGRISPVGASQTYNPLEGVLPVEFSRYGDQSLKITVGPLPPGEYSVGRVVGAPIVYCFGVD